MLHDDFYFMIHFHSLSAMLIPIFGIFLFVRFISSQTITSCNVDRLDECSLKVFIYGDPEHKFATNANEARAICRKSKENESCVRDYIKKCEKSPFIKQYFQIMMKGPSEVIKKSCTKTGIREVLRHQECLRSSKEGLDKCTVEAINSLLRVTRANESLWLPGSCCYLGQGRKCTLDVINGKCTGSSINYMVKSLNSFHGDAFDLACGSNYIFGSKKCDEIISKMPILAPGTKIPKSFLPVTLELMSKFFT